MDCFSLSSYKLEVLPSATTEFQFDPLVILMVI